MGPPLAELYAQLRARGFAIGVDDHVRIGRLITRDATWTLAALRVAIASLVTTDVRDRAAFDAAWTAWLGSTSAMPTAVAPAPLAAAPVARHVVRRVVAGGLVAVALAAIVAWLVPRPSPIAVPVAIDAAAPAVVATVAPDAAELRDAAASSAAVTTAPQGDLTAMPHVVLDAAIAAVDAAPAPIAAAVAPAAPIAPPPPIVVEPAPSIGPLVAMFAAIVGAMLAAVAIVLALHAARRRKKFLPGPWTYRATIPPTTRPILGSLAIEDTASALTFQADAAGTELDLGRTVDRTLAAGGLLTPVYQQPHAAPVYVVLEDTARGTERWRFLYDELLRGLAREGVELVRYTFDAVPETCGSPEGRPAALRDIVEHADALIAIGDGNGGLDPDTDQPAEWIALLRQVPRRIWINPLPEAAWSAGAKMIARETPMERGVARGVARLRGAVVAAAPARALPAIIERSPSSAGAVIALRAYLGDEAFRLLCGVALAGQPTIAALCWLGEQLAVGLDETAWLNLATLPWIASGIWYDGQRERLIAAASPELVRRVAPLADRLLAASEPAAGSAAHLAWQLDVSTRLAERGDRGGASIIAARITSSPLAPAARRQLAALGLRDRRGRALAAYAGLGAALLVLGLDPLGRTAAHTPPRAASPTPGVELVAIDATRAELRIPVFEKTVSASVRLHDVEDERDFPFEVDRDARPIELIVVVEPPASSTERAALEQFVSRIPRSAHRQFVAFSASVTTFPHDRDVGDLEPLRHAREAPVLRAAVDRGLRIAASYPRSAHARLLVVASGSDDELGPTPHALALRAAQLGIPIDTIGDSTPTVGLVNLGELARTSGGTFRYETDFDTVIDQLAGTMAIAEVDIATLPDTLILEHGKAHTRIAIPAVAGLPVSGAVGTARLALRIVALAIAALALFELLGFAWLALRRRVPVLR